MRFAFYTCYCLISNPFSPLSSENEILVKYHENVARKYFNQMNNEIMIA